MGIVAKAIVVDSEVGVWEGAGVRIGKAVDINVGVAIGTGVTPPHETKNIEQKNITETIFETALIYITPK